VRRPEQVPELEALGAAETVVGDLRCRTDVLVATKGASTVYHICPNVQSDEFEMGQAMLEAAVGAGVQRFVYHSVLHPQIEKMPHHWQKLRVEERLFESNLDYTILQPAAYMQNLLAQWDRIVHGGVYPVPYAVSAPMSLVDLEDVAEAAAAVLNGTGHAGATYELVGPQVLTQTDVAAILSEQTGRQIRAEAVPLATWESQARDSGIGGYALDTLLRMFRYYEEHGFWGNGKVLGWLLGREPTSFAAFVRRQLWRIEGRGLDQDDS
jgi:uncharacterized protein YbjT (DUF2867 family)